MGWHLIVIVVVAVVIVGVIVAFARAGSRARRGDDAGPVVSLTLTVSAVWAGFSVIGGIVVALVALLQPQVQIKVPVREYWPALPDGAFVEGASAARVGGGFTSADLLVDGLSTGARVLWAISQALAWFVPAAIAALIAIACFQLLAGRAFAPVVARMAMVTAVVVAVGGLAAEMLGDIAGSMASAQVLEYSGGGWEGEIPGIDSPLDAWIPQSMLQVDLPFWPIAAGLAFAALAAVFRYGSRLQRDTEGLV